MEIEQVAEMARTVAALPQGHQDFFNGLVADERAAIADAARVADLRAMSDEDAVQFAIKEASDVFATGELHERLLRALRDAGFVRGDLKLLGEARESLEGVIRLIVDSASKFPVSFDYAELNRLVMQAAKALSEVEAGRS